ncbi:hypothetical protein RFI_03039 [Reticulomyxa filosa]|uniref:Uncharacterized protein n=1 Tax=Reticulomyxa filosa TaxID=46433 RepID=X6P771_RETFI|nr:hypothetical protein RFI_03039 [Reticulomyxa filosa]|eukprot:ETO34056.1 hypothetical protein RFI_03039 [Reticulomyxa filosa]
MTSLGCQKCRLIFQTNEEMTNHIKNFCVNSVYFQPDLLLKQLRQELHDKKQEPNSEYVGVKKAASNDVEQVHKEGHPLDSNNVKMGLEGSNQQTIKHSENDLDGQLMELRHRQQKIVEERKQVASYRIFPCFYSYII